MMFVFVLGNLQMEYGVYPKREPQNVGTVITLGMIQYGIGELRDRFLDMAM